MDDYARASGLAGEEAAAGLEEAGRGLTHPLSHRVRALNVPLGILRVLGSPVTAIAPPLKEHFGIPPKWETDRYLKKVFRLERAYSGWGRMACSKAYSCTPP
jgi:hypothetical protein